MASVVFAINNGIAFGFEHIANAVMIENLGLEFKPSGFDIETQRQTRFGDKLASQPPSFLEVIRCRIPLVGSIPERSALREDVAEQLRVAKCAEGSGEPASARPRHNGMTGI